MVYIFDDYLHSMVNPIIKEKIKSILKDNIYMSIATSSLCAHPWISNVYFAHDSKLNFYWYSSKQAKHSLLIKSNPYISICIFNSTAIEDVDALYIEAKATEIKTKKILIQGLITYGAKLLKTHFISNRQDKLKFIKQYSHFIGNSSLRFYKAVPLRLWKLAPSKIYKGKYIDSRIEVLVKDLL